MTMTRRAGLGHDYWRLWSSAALSGLAEGTFKVSMPLLALTYTRSPVLVAGAGFVVGLPWLLLSLPAGALADRGDRRRIMVWADCARAAVLALAAGLAVTGLGSIWMLYAAAFAAGTAETLYASAAQALIPAVVARPLLTRANAVQQITDQTTAQFAGPALGGVLVSLGIGAALGAPAAVWCLAVAVLRTLRGGFAVPHRHPTTIRADIATGLRFLAASVVLRSVSLCVAATNFTGAAAAAVFVLYAVGPGSALGLHPATYGLLLAASTAGTIAGAPIAGRAAAALGHRFVLCLNAFTQAVQILVPVCTPNPSAIAAGYALGGLGVAVWNVDTVTLRQLIIPGHLLGRVISTHRLISWGSLSLGALAGGLLAGALGLRTTLLVTASSSLLGAIALIPVTAQQVNREIGAGT